MNIYELRDHIKQQIPFLVYGDVCRYNPVIHHGDPHEWYRAEIGQANIAVNVETEQEFYARRDKYRLENAQLRARVAALERVTEAAGEYIAASPCDPDITSKQREKWQAYQAAIAACVVR